MADKVVAEICKPLSTSRDFGVPVTQEFSIKGDDTIANDMINDGAETTVFRFDDGLVLAV